MEGDGPKPRWAFHVERRELPPPSIPPHKAHGQWQICCGHKQKCSLSAATKSPFKSANNRKRSVTLQPRHIQKSSLPHHLFTTALSKRWWTRTYTHKSCVRPSTPKRFATLKHRFGVCTIAAPRVLFWNTDRDEHPVFKSATIYMQSRGLAERDHMVTIHQAACKTRVQPVDRLPWNSSIQYQELQYKYNVSQMATK